MDKIQQLEAEVRQLKAALRNLNDRLKRIEYEPAEDHKKDISSLKGKLIALEHKVRESAQMARTALYLKK